MHDASHINHLWRWIILGISVAFVACKHFDEPEQEVKIPVAPNIAITDLREMVGQRRVTINDPIVIGGYVTTSDEEANFYRSFCIEDASGGVEVMAGLYDLHNIYPEGSYITIYLEGCAVGQHNGVLQVGTEAASYSQYPTDYFSSRVLLDRHITSYDIISPVAPKPVTFNDLTPSLCGRLVNMHSMQFIHNAAETPTNEWSGYNIFADREGNTIAVYNSSAANYAHKSIPAERVNITGILQYAKVEGQDMYIIKMRYEKDCLPTN